jgi:L-rhamnose-H+ transport protein
MPEAIWLGAVAVLIGGLMEGSFAVPIVTLATTILFGFLLAGFISNGGYCAVLVRRNRTFHGFRKPGARNHFFLVISMGLLWTGGLLLCGWGASALGDLEAAISWPIFQATMIVISSVLGATYAEWRGAGPRIVRVNLLALAIPVAAMAVLSVGNRV